MGWKRRRQGGKTGEPLSGSEKYKYELGLELLGLLTGSSELMGGSKARAECSRESGVAGVAERGGDIRGPPRREMTPDIALPAEDQLVSQWSHTHIGGLKRIC